MPRRGMLVVMRGGGGGGGAARVLLFAVVLLVLLFLLKDQLPQVIREWLEKALAYLKAILEKLAPGAGWGLEGGEGSGARSGDSDRPGSSAREKAERFCANRGGVAMHIPGSNPEQYGCGDGALYPPVSINTGSGWPRSPGGGVFA